MLWRAFRLIGAIFLLGWLGVFIHEAFHFLVTNSLGYEGVVSYMWAGSGYMEYVAPYPPENLRILIGLAGGLGTGLIFLLFWLLTGHPDVRKHPSEINNSFPFLLFGISQLIYSPFDAFNIAESTWGSGLGMALGFVAPLLLYWKPLLAYLDGKED